MNSSLAGVVGRGTGSSFPCSTRGVTTSSTTGCGIATSFGGGDGVSVFGTVIEASICLASALGLLRLETGVT